MSKYIEISSLGSLSCRGYGFSYMSKKEFKEYSKEQVCKVVGSTRLKKVDWEDTHSYGVYLSFGKHLFKMDESSSGLHKGYIHIGNNEFIAYKRSVVPLIIILILVILMGCLVLKGYHKNGSIELEDLNPINLVNDTEAVSDIPHYDFQTQGSYEISDSNTRIKVWNPETNTRVFQYSVYVDDELIGQTKGISPGNMMEVECESLLGSKGEHELVLDLTVLNEETGEVVGKAQRNAVLTVK